MTATAHARRFGLHERQTHPEIQRPPPPTPTARVKPRTAPPTDPATTTLTPVRPRADDHLPLDADLHVLNDRTLQTQQPRPYPDPAHVASASPGFQPSTSRNPRRDAACAPLQPLKSPPTRAGAPLLSTSARRCRPGPRCRVPNGKTPRSTGSGSRIQIFLTHWRNSHVRVI